jgi:hypothetical protein
MTAGDPSATSALALGAHPITAVYSDDANNAEYFTILNQLVNAPTGGATSTALSSSINPSQLGQSVTFTATVSGSSPTGSACYCGDAIVRMSDATMNAEKKRRSTRPPLGESAPAGEMTVLGTWKWPTTIKGTSMIRNRLRPIHPGEVLRKEFRVPLE